MLFVDGHRLGLNPDIMKKGGKKATVFTFLIHKDALDFCGKKKNSNHIELDLRLSTAEVTRLCV